MARNLGDRYINREHHIVVFYEDHYQCASSPCSRVGSERAILGQSFLTAHRDNEGKVDADGEVGDGKHVRRSKLDKLQEPNEALRVVGGPADSDDHMVDEKAQGHHQPAVDSKTAVQQSVPSSAWSPGLGKRGSAIM